MRVAALEPTISMLIDFKFLAKDFRSIKKSLDCLTVLRIRKKTPTGVLDKKIGTMKTSIHKEYYFAETTTDTVERPLESFENFTIPSAVAKIV